MCPECGLPMTRGKCPQCDNYTPPADHRLALIALVLLALLLLAWVVF